MINNAVIPELRKMYAKYGYCMVQNLFKTEVLNKIKTESIIASEKYASAPRNVDMNFSKRRLQIVSGSDVNEHKEEFPFLHEFAINEEVVEALRQISDNPKLKYGRYRPLFPCHLNIQSEPTFNHGWHLDDAGFKLVIQPIWKPGPNEKGGRVGLINNFLDEEYKFENVNVRLKHPSKKLGIIKDEDLKDTDEIEKCVGYNVPKKHVTMVSLGEMEGYFMEGRSTIHMVEPLTDFTHRMSVCFSYDDVHDLSNYYETSDKLYKKDDESLEESVEKSKQNKIRI